MLEGEVKVRWKTDAKIDKNNEVMVTGGGRNEV